MKVKDETPVTGEGGAQERLPAEEVRREATPGTEDGLSEDKARRSVSYVQMREKARITTGKRGSAIQ